MVARVRTVWTGVAGTPYYTNIYCLGSGEVMAEAVGLFWQAIAPHIRNDLLADVESEIAEIDVNTGQQTGVTTWAGVTRAGGAAGDPLPTSNQGLVQLLTGTWVNGRQLRGRIFVPGPAEADAAQGIAATTYRNDLRDAFADTIMSVATQDTNPLVVWSRTYGQTAQVTGFEVWDQFAIQRSRRD